MKAEKVLSILNRQLDVLIEECKKSAKALEKTDIRSARDLYSQAQAYRSVKEFIKNTDVPDKEDDQFNKGE